MTATDVNDTVVQILAELHSSSLCTPCMRLAAPPITTCLKERVLGVEHRHFKSKSFLSTYLAVRLEIIRSDRLCPFQVVPNLMNHGFKMARQFVLPVGASAVFSPPPLSQLNMCCPVALDSISFVVFEFEYTRACSTEGRDEAVFALIVCENGAKGCTGAAGLLVIHRDKFTAYNQRSVRAGRHFDLLRLSLHRCWLRRRTVPSIMQLGLVQVCQIAQHMASSWCVAQLHWIPACGCITSPAVCGHQCVQC